MKLGVSSPEASALTVHVVLAGIVASGVVLGA
jgi:hypothetical protein